MILVETFFAHNELRNFSYLIYDKDKGDSWVIDPYDAGPVTDYIKKKGLVLKGILNTHQHWDHVQGNGPLQETFRAPVTRLSNKEEITLDGRYSLQGLHTPGHTMDHQVFVWKGEGKALALFAGDTLFNSGVGNCKNGGDVNLLFETTKKLAVFPSETILYPGHDYRKRNLEFALSVEPENREVREALATLNGEATESLPPSTLGDEVKVNPFLHLSSAELQDSLSGPGVSERELFIKLRQLRDQW